MLSEVTGLMQGAVIVCCANRLGWLPGQAVSPVWVTVGQLGALALEGSWQVDAACSLGAGWRCQFRALVDVSADTIRQQPVTTRTHAESRLPSSVDTLLMLWAWVCRRAVLAGSYAKVIFPLESWWAAAVAAIHAKQVPRAVELVGASNQFKAVVARVSSVSRRTFTGSFVVDRSATCVFSTGSRHQAGIVTFQHVNIASLAAGTVVVMCAFSLGWFTSSMEGFSCSSRWARAMVAAHIIVALGTVGAREWMLFTLVNVSAHPVRQESKSLGTDAEASVAAFVHALLVFRARIGCGAVDASQDAEVVLLPEWSWTATTITKALQVSRAFLVAGTRPGNSALDVGVSSKPAWAEALRPVVDTPALGRPTTHTWLETSIVTLLRQSVARFTVLAVGVARAALDALSAAPVVGVTHQVVGTAALVTARQVCARSTMRAWATAMQTLVDVFTL